MHVGCMQVFGGCSIEHMKDTVHDENLADQEMKNRCIERVHDHSIK